MFQRGQGPTEHEVDDQVVAGILVLGYGHDLVLEGQQGPDLDVQREAEVEWSAAGRLGMEVDLEGLMHGVGLDEVAFVVDVEAVICGVVLQVGHEACDVDDGHGGPSWLSALGDPGTGPRRPSGGAATA